MYDKATVCTRFMETCQKVKRREKLKNMKLFTHRLGLPERGLDNVLGSHTLPVKFLALLVEHFPYVNIEYILTGKGRCFKEEEV
jgi:hypothetical protein